MIKTGNPSIPFYRFANKVSYPEIKSDIKEFTVKQEQVDTGQLEVETVNENDEPEDDIQADEELDEDQIAK